MSTGVHHHEDFELRAHPAATHPSKKSHTADRGAKPHREMDDGLSLQSDLDDGTTSVDDIERASNKDRVLVEDDPDFKSPVEGEGHVIAGAEATAVVRGLSRNGKGERNLEWRNVL